MREVFVHRDYTRVGLYQSILDAADIPSFIRNQHTNNLMTGIPSWLFFPALCVVRDEDYDRAMQVLIHQRHPPEMPTVDWHCPKCGEEVPGNFEWCWQCGTPRSG